MERAKIRDTDNVRTFFLSRFFIEYLLLVREKEQIRRETGKGKEPENGDEEDMLLGYAIVMAEMDSVKWVFSRLRMTMDERVSRDQAKILVELINSHQHGPSYKPVSIVLPK